MEDLIYLILLMAWVVFALYRRSQKKNATARKASAQPGPQQDIKPLPTLQEILFGEEESYPGGAMPRPVTPADEGSYSPEPVETNFEKEYARRGIMSVESQVRASQKSEIQRSDLQIDEISDEIDTNDKKEDYFDLRKAVVYSEILNRPYV
jgi:hypothetical protein